MRVSSSGFSHSSQDAEKRCLNSELWHACAGPLVSLPAVGSRVVYFPQGHSEQVAASTNKEIDAHIPNYPNLPPQLICQLHDVTMHADAETDEVYAQMTLQPLSTQEQKDAYSATEMGTPSKQPTNYFCKTLTASDTSTHGGFSVPRRAAEKVFPPLDFSQQPPAQELIARDLHDNEWKFRHIFRGQPKRHLLTTGWSVFVSAKRLVAGDSVLFIWNEKNQLLLGIRRANRPQTVMPSSVLSSDSMHIGLLAAAAHAASTNSCFTIFYNPRASPSEFVIPFTKYAKAVYHTRISVGMRFRMLFETEESSIRRYMGTITGIGDLDPVRWSSSYWRSVKVGWDESTAGERQPRVSLWEIEPLTTFPMYPSPFPLRLKRPWSSELPSLNGFKGDDLSCFNSHMMWLRGEGVDRGMQSLNFQGAGMPWMQSRFDNSVFGIQSDMYQAMAAAALQEIRTGDFSKQAGLSHLQFPQAQNGSNPPLHQCQSQSPQMFLQAQLLSQNQAHLLQQLQHQNSFNGQTQPQLHPSSQIPNSISTVPQLVSATFSQSPAQPVISALCQTQNFPDSNQNSVTPSTLPLKTFPDPNQNPVTTSILSPLHTIMGSFVSTDSSQLLGLPRNNTISSDCRLPKRAAIEPLFPSGTQCVLASMDQLNEPLNNIPQTPVSLPPFPSRECSVDQEGSIDSQNHVLFGVNIDSSPLLIENRTANTRGLGSETDSTTMPFSSNFMNSTNVDFPLNRASTPSRCLDDTNFLQSPGNVDQENLFARTFVKVYKSGSFGRSLDITRFSSYNELRSELGRMFGLEGQLDDPIRSGWQLVFVDRENDVLLLGDDPWQEFVNNVWCIKILNAQEVQQMGKPDPELLSSIPIQRLSNSTCEDYVNRQDSRPFGNPITSLCSLEY